MLLFASLCRWHRQIKFAHQVRAWGVICLTLHLFRISASYLVLQENANTTATVRTWYCHDPAVSE